MSRNLRNLALWLAIVLAFILMAKVVGDRSQIEKTSISELMRIGEAGMAATVDGGVNSRIDETITDRGGVLEGAYVDDSGQRRQFRAEYVADQSRDILAWAKANRIGYEAKKSNQLVGQILMNMLPIAVLLILMVFLMRQFQSGSSKAMSFGKSRARLVTEGQIKINFDDVAGIDEVKEELLEIIHFLKDPGKFSRLGGKIPKGALLYGPPGTGKTLIARAVAGEASVPFFSISGSDFVEMFVGVGASRVRDLFEQGKKAKPCLIYIDEIDAVGRHRFTGIGGGHDEREQTLNQLLVELDGFASNEGVIVMASTNRPDVLDPALLRPGRFDRQIRVDLPDVIGREKILEVHSRDLEMAESIELKIIARGTPGFSGADLANLCNEGALLAARRNKDKIEMADLEEAKDRVMMGPERRSLAMTEKERISTAYHEAGHALVAKLTGHASHKVHKVTIIPRGRSLGLTAVLPDEEQHCQSRSQLRNILLYAMGGRAAEEIQFDEFTTGAANDLQRCTDIAHRMVCDFGMSDKIGPRTCGSTGSEVFLGKDLGRERDYSEETASTIDTEVRDFLSAAYEEAKGLVDTHRDALDRIAQALLDRESIDGHELDLLIEGEELPPLFKEGDRPTPPVPPDEPEKEEIVESRTERRVLRDPSVQPS